MRDARFRPRPRRLHSGHQLRGHVDASSRLGGAARRRSRARPAHRYLQHPLCREDVEGALAAIRADDHLRGADLIALQEMDAPGVDSIARGLGMSYVYYPAAVHPGGGKDFGNAVLVRGRIVADGKVFLPHLSRGRGMQRVAVWADVDVDGLRFRMYSLHLSADAEMSQRKRLDQVRALVAHARDHPLPVVVAGDFNDRVSVGPAFQSAGYEWVSRDLPATISWFTWDHIFARGLRLPALDRRGVADPRGSSDHRPVWADLEPAGPSTARRTATHTLSVSFFTSPRWRHSSSSICWALFRSLRKLSSIWRANPASRMPEHVLLVQLLGAHVHVARPDDRELAVHHDRLGVHHRGLVLVDLHPRLQQLLEVLVAGLPDRLGVRLLVGEQDADVHPLLRALDHRLADRLVGHEVRVGDVELLARGGERLQVGTAAWDGSRWTASWRARCAGRCSRRRGATGAGNSGKNAGPTRISPRVASATWAQLSTNADWTVAASGPVTCTMLSRHCSSLPALPSHLSATAMPPVKATRAVDDDGAPVVALVEARELAQPRGAEDLDLPAGSLQPLDVLRPGRGAHPSRRGGSAPAPRPSPSR